MCSEYANMYLEKTPSLPGHMCQGVSTRHHRHPHGSDRRSNIDSALEHTIRCYPISVASLFEMLTYCRICPLIGDPGNSDRLGYPKMGLAGVSFNLFNDLKSFVAIFVVPLLCLSGFILKRFYVWTLSLRRDILLRFAPSRSGR